MQRKTCGKCGRRRKVTCTLAITIEPLDGLCRKMLPVCLCRECETHGRALLLEAFIGAALELRGKAIV